MEYQANIHIYIWSLYIIILFYIHTVDGSCEILHQLIDGLVYQWLSHDCPCVSNVYPCLSHVYPCLSHDYPCLSHVYPCLSMIIHDYPCLSHVYPMFIHVYPMIIHVYPCLSHDFYRFSTSFNHPFTVDLSGRVFRSHLWRARSVQQGLGSLGRMICGISM